MVHVPLFPMTLVRVFAGSNRDPPAIHGRLPGAQEKRARILTARMNRAGIHSLEELKVRLDAHGEAKMKSLGRTTKEGVLDDSESQSAGAQPCKNMACVKKLVFDGFCVGHKFV